MLKDFKSLIIYILTTDHWLAELEIKMSKSAEVARGYHTYCRVPVGRGLGRTALAPGRSETRVVNPLVRQYVD